MFNWFKILDMNIAQLADQNPKIRRFLTQGFVKSERPIDHDDDVVGLFNPVTGQSLRIDLVTGDPA